MDDPKGITQQLTSRFDCSIRKICLGLRNCVLCVVWIFVVTFKRAHLYLGDSIYHLPFADCNSLIANLEKASFLGSHSYSPKSRISMRKP